MKECLSPSTTYLLTIIISISLLPIVRACSNGAMGCQICGSVSRCASCMQGYYQSSGSCIQCHSRCKTCSQYYDCTSCFEGYYWDDIYLWCYGYCSYQCKTCSISYNNCTSCSQGYYWGNNTCQLCGEGCNACTNFSVCLNCTQYYYLNSTTNSCNNCSQSCVSCNSSSNCTMCQGGYSMLSGVCEKCGPYCSSCTSNNNCTSCNYNYFFRNGSCISCGYCATCSDNGCTACSHSNSYITNGTCQICGYYCSSCSATVGCTSCMSSYYLANGACKSCGDGCNSCAGEKNCTSCSYNYFISNGICFWCGYCRTCDQNLGCRQCYNSSYYTLNGACVYCAMGCMTCNYAVCTACYDGYFIQDGHCQFCSYGCEQCTSYTICTKCLWYNQSCVEYSSSQSESLSAGVIVAITVSCVIFLIIVGGIIYKIRKNRLREQLDAGQIPPIPGSSMDIIPMQDPLMVKEGQWIRVDLQKFSQCCGICLYLGNCLLICGHIYHPHCIAEWLRRNKYCPLCRKEVLTDRITVVCETCYLYGFTKSLEELVKVKPANFRNIHNCA